MEKRDPEKSGEESRRYADPMRKLGFGVFGDANLELQQESPYPPVDELFDGFYADFQPAAETGRDFLIGSEAIIGSQLGSRVATSENPDERVFLNRDGQTVGWLRGTDAGRLNELEAQGWQIRCYLTTITYIAAERRFGAELACMAFFPGAEQEYRAAFSEFTKNIADRISHGGRPRLRIQQNQIGKVLESGGTWFLTSEEARPSLPRGTQVYKRRRSLTDSLVAVSQTHRIGCTVLASAFWIILIALIVWRVVVWIH